MKSRDLNEKGKRWLGVMEFYVFPLCYIMNIFLQQKTRIDEMMINDDD